MTETDAVPRATPAVSCKLDEKGGEHAEHRALPPAPRFPDEGSKSASHVHTSLHDAVVMSFDQTLVLHLFDDPVLETALMVRENRGASVDS